MAKKKENERPTIYFNSSDLEVREVRLKARERGSWQLVMGEDGKPRVMRWNGHKLEAA